MNFTTSPTCQIPLLPEIFSQIFQEKTDGYFVEVGAFDGYTYSNTWGLSELGWSGLMIEAIPEYADKCRKMHEFHPGIKVVNEIAGSGQSVVMYKAGEYSTYSELFRIHAPAGWNPRFNLHGMVATRKLDDILADNCGGKKIDLMVIDVEGSEKTVLESLTLCAWRPTLAIVEVHEKHHNKFLSADAHWINEYFTREGYKIIYSDDCNNIYWNEVEK